MMISGLKMRRMGKLSREWPDWNVNPDGRTTDDELTGEGSDLSKNLAFVYWYSYGGLPPPNLVKHKTRKT